jgi:hypothetical protein
MTSTPTGRNVPRFWKWVAVAIGTVVVLALGVCAFFRLTFDSNYVSSNIVDFHPTTFPAKADRTFFYSIGDELKYSDEITPAAPTLLRGHIGNFLVSPDGKRIAAVANGALYVISPEENSFKQVTNVDSIYREPKPIGRGFFRDDGFQWSEDSNVLFLMKDEYYESKGSQLFSQKGELWRYDLASEKLQTVLKPFPAFTYFFGKRGVYFSVPTEKGDERLRYFDGQTVIDIGDVGAYDIPRQQLMPGDSAFFSFTTLHDNPLFSSGVGLIESQDKGPQDLLIGDKLYLSFTLGEGMKGPHYCSNLYNSAFLPGGRYFLLNVGCGNFDGQLLIDRDTGRYQQMPKDTRVYLALTTNDIPHYRISCGGIMPN